MKKLILRFKIWHWKRNPDKFIEKFFGIRLWEYQKKMIKDIVRYKPNE